MRVRLLYSVFLYVDVCYIVKVNITTIMRIIIIIKLMDIFFCLLLFIIATPFQQTIKSTKHYIHDDGVMHVTNVYLVHGIIMWKQTCRNLPRAQRM